MTVVRMKRQERDGFFAIQHLRRDPRASVLVTNTFGEPLRCGAFDSRVTIERLS